jgi:hypothetical protein
VAIRAAGEVAHEPGSITLRIRRVNLQAETVCVISDTVVARHYRRGTNTTFP